MPIAVTMFIDPSAAPVFGLAGLAAQMTWPLFRGRRAMLTTQLASTCLYATSYALIGQETATAICLTGAIQTTIALLAGDRPALSRIGVVFLPVVLVIGMITFSGLPTLFAVTACCLTMIGRMQTETIRMRGVQLSASPFGAAHDLAVGAWPCLAGAVLSFSIALMALRREMRRRRELPAVA